MPRRAVCVEHPEIYSVDVGYAGGLQTIASFGPDVDQGLARMFTLTHDGSANGYTALIWMIPEDDLGFVALTNGNNFADETRLSQLVGTRAAPDGGPGPYCFVFQDGLTTLVSFQDGQVVEHYRYDPKPRSPADFDEASISLWTESPFAVWLGEEARTG